MKRINFKKILRLFFGRTFILIISLLFQMLFFFLVIKTLNDSLMAFYWISMVLTAIVVIYIINDNCNPSFKLAWMVPVLVFPVFGAILYIFLKIQLGSYIINKKHMKIIADTRRYILQNTDVINELGSINAGEKNFAQYMNIFGGYPVYKNTSAEYFPLGEDKFKVLITELASAKKYIFMEYFIIERGEMWNTILDILIQKVNEGVEVRVMYDGMCSLILLPHSYPKTLNKLGIKCKMFSPLKPALTTVQNNRDHRKIVVIDGHTAFTGGINLADEYINKYERFGHWKDTAIMLKGEAVKSFAVMFLQIWNITETEKEDYTNYICSDYGEMNQDKSEGNPSLNLGGYFIPYSDSPLDKENVSENVYIDILYRARNYVHIMTPYLIPSNEMMLAITYAAKRGVEVVVVMPHVPDKMYAYLLARTYYAELITAGVKIYEYTPGFIHAKMFTSDNEKAVVGSINIDYRSLFLHFECAAYCYSNSVVSDIEKDFRETIKKSRQIFLEDCKKYSIIKGFIGRFLRLFAPLM